MFQREELANLFEMITFIVTFTSVVDDPDLINVSFLTDKLGGIIEVVDTHCEAVEGIDRTFCFTGWVRACST